METMASSEHRTTRRPPIPDGTEGAHGRTLDFSTLYDQWFHPVSRWARALGGPEADLDDLTQEVFLVVRRKLEAFDGRNLAGWLYAITARTVSDQRRRAWFRNIFRRPRDIELADFADDEPDPEAALSRKQSERQLYHLLDGMSEKRRTAFLLYEVEGHSGEEIAQLLSVPVATVWTRLHHARKEFLALVEELRRKGDS